MNDRLSAYQVCTRCVMDMSDPQITFDNEGVCNHCHQYDELVRTNPQLTCSGADILAAKVQQIKAVGAGKPYDCIIGVSGGVDSTFVAWKVKSLGLRPLAVHVDNGWNSEIAVSNINSILSKMNIDLYTVVLDWEEFKDIQTAFLKASTPDAEVPSDHAIFASLYLQAQRLGVRYVITGLNMRTETHLPKAWSQGHLDWGYLKAVHNSFGKLPIKTFPHFNFYQYITGFRHSQETLNILDYVEYSKNDALKFLQKELGWRDYGGKHFENVYTRWYQGFYLPRKFGFDKRRSHLSSRICSNELTREFALQELQKETYDARIQQQDCDYVMKKLGFSPAEFEAVMSAPPRCFEDFSSYDKFRAGPLFRVMLGLYQIAKMGLFIRTR
jgi:N-acetyl sugar amidotransferase